LQQKQRLQLDRYLIVNILLQTNFRRRLRRPCSFFD